MENYYPDTYETSRENFKHNLGLVSSRWSHTRQGSRSLSVDPGLSIDWIWAEPLQKKNLVIVSTGQHGIEGFVGAAMLKIFFEEFAPRLNAGNTGLLLIHAINPWGMKHHRKANENSVDLNRNFIFDGHYNPDNNPQFKELGYLITPQHQVRLPIVEHILFWVRLTKALLSMEPNVLASAPLLGQCHTPKGFYYGGTQPEESTSVMMDLCREALMNYQSVTHLDMHTGYGPRYQMTITLSPNDPMTSEEARARFNYPLVLKVNPEEFYAIYGDMVDYFYKLWKAIARDKEFFSCTFECGTFGDSILARLRSLRVMLLENQLHWRGAVNEAAEQAVRHEFDELYFPAESHWRAKVLADGRQAFEGILHACGLL